MKPNQIIKRMEEGRPATGWQLAFPSTTLVELLGVAGLDFVLLDGEHGTFSRESLDDLCRVADLAGLTVIARVPDIAPSTILEYTDRGVQGVRRGSGQEVSWRRDPRRPRVEYFLNGSVPSWRATRPCCKSKTPV